MFLILIKLNLYISNHIILLVLRTDTLCLTQGYRDFFLCFLIEILCFTFRSMICFQLIFVRVVSYKSRWYVCGHTIVLTAFVQKTGLLTLSCLCTFTKNQLTVFMFLNSPFCSIDLCGYHFTNTTLSWFYSFILGLKLRQCLNPIVLTTGPSLSKTKKNGPSSSFVFPYKFQNLLVGSYQKSPLVFRLRLC